MSRRVTVAFEFASVEEAVVFLGKQIPEVAKAVVVAAKPAPTPTATQPATEKRGRGRPSKKSKGAAGPDSSPSSAETPAAPVTESAAPETVVVTPPASAAAVPTKEDLVAAMQKVMDSKGIEPVMATLAKFGVEGAGQLPEAKRVEFIAYCTRVATGEVDPLK